MLGLPSADFYSDIYPVGGTDDLPRIDSFVDFRDFESPVGRLNLNRLWPSGLKYRLDRDFLAKKTI